VIKFPRYTEGLKILKQLIQGIQFLAMTLKSQRKRGDTQGHKQKGMKSSLQGEATCLARRALHNLHYAAYSKVQIHNNQCTRMREYPCYTSPKMCTCLRLDLVETSILMSASEWRQTENWLRRSITLSARRVVKPDYRFSQIALPYLQHLNQKPEIFARVHFCHVKDCSHNHLPV
jgi:hypothetical protein